MLPTISKYALSSYDLVWFDSFCVRVSTITAV